MDTNALCSSIASRSFITYARSSGPGGQNVNKVNTKAVLHLRISELEGLGEEEKNLIRAKLASRINTEDELVLHVQDERSRVRNRDLAVARAAKLILGAVTPKKLRHKTKPSAAAKEQRLRAKTARSRLKQGRRISDRADE